ncbi:MAG: integrase, partial [Clostridia bacterium]
MDYFKERDKKNNQRLRDLRDNLPEFVEEFFVGIEPTTTSLTRLNYAYDLRIFFDFLIKKIRDFRNFDIFDFQISDLEKISVTNLETYLEYLTVYEYDGKEYTNGEKGKARKLSTVRTFFKFFFNRDKISSNVASKVTM